MSSGSWSQIHVQCPFYKSDDGKQRIVCEGVIEDSSLSMFFQKKVDYQKQMEVFCCMHYRNCEVYRLLMDKYEEE